MKTFTVFRNTLSLPEENIAYLMHRPSLLNFRSNDDSISVEVSVSSKRFSMCGDTRLFPSVFQRSRKNLFRGRNYTFYRFFPYGGTPFAYFPSSDATFVVAICSQPGRDLFIRMCVRCIYYPRNGENLRLVFRYTIRSTRYGFYLRRRGSLCDKATKQRSSCKTAYRCLQYENFAKTNQRVLYLQDFEDWRKKDVERYL